MQFMTMVKTKGGSATGAPPRALMAPAQCPSAPPPEAGSLRRHPQADSTPCLPDHRAPATGSAPRLVSADTLAGEAGPRRSRSGTWI